MKIVRESLALSPIDLEELDKFNSRFREFTNSIFYALSKMMGVSDAAGTMEENEYALKVMYDEGLTGSEAIQAIKKLEAEY